MQQTHAKSHKARGLARGMKKAKPVPKRQAPGGELDPRPGPGDPRTGLRHPSPGPQTPPKVALKSKDIVVGLRLRLSDSPLISEMEAREPRLTCNCLSAPLRAGLGLGLEHSWAIKVQLRLY